MDPEYLVSQNPFLKIEDGKLFLEGVDLSEAAHKYGTPLFVVSEAYLRKNVNEYITEFEKYWPEGKVKIMPSVKANPIVAVRKILAQEGAGCDVFGPGELECALRAGVTGKDITLNGSIKDSEVIQKALKVGATIILDSPQDLELCEQLAQKLNVKALVMFRLKPWLGAVDNDSDFAPGALIRDLTQTIKYGIPTSEVLTMAERVNELKFVEVIGVHIHMGRHSKELEVWQELVVAYMHLTKRISEYWPGWQPRVINFGGGFAASLDKETRVVTTEYETPTVASYAKVLTTTLREEMQRHGFNTEGVEIQAEPGRAVHNQTGVHLTQVRNLKSEEINIKHKWAEVDTSEVFLGIPGFNPTPPFDYIVANKAEEPLTESMDIVGLTCNAEWLFQGVQLPKLDQGDVITLLNTGSYIEPMSANFNALPRPGTLLVSGSKSFMIRRHETTDDVFRRDQIPDYLD